MNNETGSPKEIIIFLSSGLITTFMVLTIAVTLNYVSINKKTIDPLREPQNFALLIATSEGYKNYRHQADIARSYSLLLQAKIPKENIIVFSFDDIANSSYNPFKGELYSINSNQIPEEYYKNLKIDYSGRFVNKRTFKEVLLGKKYLLRSNRVFDINVNDNIFIYIDGHGGHGYLKFPYDNDFYTDEVLSFFNDFSKTELFNKMVIHVEACYAGSVFENMKNNNKIHVFSASPKNKPSYASFCYPNDLIKNQNIGTCITNSYSYFWMTYVEISYNFNNFSIKQDDVEKYTDSKVNFRTPTADYGDNSFINLSAFNFVGNRIKLNITDDKKQSYKDELKDEDTSNIKINYAKLLMISQLQNAKKEKDIIFKNLHNSNNSFISFEKLELVDEKELKIKSEILLINELEKKIEEFFMKFENTVSLLWKIDFSKSYQKINFKCYCSFILSAMSFSLVRKNYFK